MADLPSFDDLFRVARDEALYRNAQLTQDAIERDGSDSNVIVAAGVAAADEVVAQLAQGLASLFVDSSAGTYLDRLVFDRYGLTRNAAAPAVGQVVLTTATSNPSSFVIPVGTQFSTPDGIVFTSTDASDTFPASSTGPVYVNVQSTLAGSNQQAAIGTITAILSQISGAPSNLSVTNVAATAGAADEETDDALRNRARQFWPTARRATLSALVQGALSVSGVVSAQAFENPTSGFVSLVVSDAFTASLANLTTPVATYQTQAQTFAANVLAGLNDYRAFGIAITVTVAQVVLQPIQLALTFPAGADTVTVAANAANALVAYTNGLPPGATWSVQAAESVLQGVSGLQYTGNEVVVPVGNVVSTPLQVIRTLPALVTTYTPSSTLA